jgi:hypothetical protein
MPRVQPHSAPTAAHLAPPSRTLMGAFFRLRLHRSTWTVAKSIFPSYVSSRCSNSISSAVFSWQRGRQVDARAVSAGAQRGEQEREQAIGGGALGLASRSCARSPSHQSLHCASHQAGVSPTVSPSPCGGGSGGRDLLWNQQAAVNVRHVGVFVEPRHAAAAAGGSVSARVHEAHARRPRAACDPIKSIVEVTIRVCLYSEPVSYPSAPLTFSDEKNSES